MAWDNSNWKTIGGKSNSIDDDYVFIVDGWAMAIK